METDFFDIGAGLLQRDTVDSYLLIICLDDVLRSRRYPAWTITDADYADDIALLPNIPAQAESLLHSLEQAAGDIGLHWM